MSGLELDMARKFHSPIWAAVGSAWVLTTFVVGMGVGFVSSEGMDAFDAETLHFVDGAFGGGFGGSFGFVHVGEYFGEETAKNVFTFGVRVIG